MEDEVATITWERVISFARRLEASARRNVVTQEDASRLVLLLLQFDRNILGHGVVRSSRNDDVERQ